jgi:transposase-like protein
MSRSALAGRRKQIMADVPLCPNCSRPMHISRTLPHAEGETEVNVFICSNCNVSFITENHLPIAGDRAH